jgi:hypothetical protein
VTRKPSGAPTPKAILSKPPARPSNPFDALATVASSSSWIPDPEPGPSPSLVPTRHKSRLPAATPAETSASGLPRPNGVVLWGSVGGVTALLAAVALFMALRPGPRLADASAGNTSAPAAATTPAPTTPPAALPAAAPFPAPVPVVAASTPQAPAVQRTIDLLRLIDPQRDAEVGKWRMQPGAAGAVLESDDTTLARIAIPYDPPAEYDFKITFTRTAGDNCMTQIFTHGGNQAALVLYGWKNTICGLQHINKIAADKNSTGVRGLANTNGEKHTSLLRVRKDSIEVYLDGKRIIRLPSFGSELSNQHWPVPAPLGLGTQNSPTLIHSAELTEITGQGRPLR